MNIKKLEQMNIFPESVSQQASPESVSQQASPESVSQQALVDAIKDLLGNKEKLDKLVDQVQSKYLKDGLGSASTTIRVEVLKKHLGEGRDFNLNFFKKAENEFDGEFFKAVLKRINKNNKKEEISRFTTGYREPPVEIAKNPKSSPIKRVKKKWGSIEDSLPIGDRE